MSDAAVPERFDRLARMVGPDGLARLRAARVTVIGLGAVGSYAVEGLARAGVGTLRLVDFDEVRASNVNRNLLALASTVGRGKAEVAAERARDINPDCRAEPRAVFAHEESMTEILAPPPDLVLDCIDALSPKVAVLAAALGAGVPVISSMGAALRREPALVRTGPLSGVRGCPLARHVRRRLRRAGLPLDFTCVWSSEPVADLPESAMAEPELGEFLERGRPRRVLGSLPTLTGIFGLVAANEALRRLLAAGGKP